MKNTVEIKRKRNNTEGQLKLKNGMQNNTDAFMEECRLQKQFFSGQVSIEEYRDKGTILKINQQNR